MRRLRAVTGSYGWASNRVMTSTVYYPTDAAAATALALPFRQLYSLPTWMLPSPVVISSNSPPPFSLPRTRERSMCR